MKILVINSGSSSIKYQLFDLVRRVVLASGLVERIGESAGRVRHTVVATGAEQVLNRPIVDHRDGLRRMADLLLAANSGVIATPGEIAAIGHRVVHGGEQFSQPTVITEAVKATIRDLSPFAPLHNPANLQGIDVAEEIFPEATQVAVFDTAFHQTMPAMAYRYAVPNDLYAKHGIRVYGFHGTSHWYVSKRAAAYLDASAESLNLITAHLGNGASITAVQGGMSVDTSMGFSPLDGLIMGTRSGDLDPAVVFYLSERLGMSLADIDKLLNKQSGLLGLTGANDLRDIEARAQHGDNAAQLALEMYAYRIRKYIGAYMAALGRVDALVFTAGVGENSVTVRRMVCEPLSYLGIVLDEALNRAGGSGMVTAIHSAESRVQILIIPTNEELEIAEQTAALLTAGTVS
ncbi:MAG: acetate kinase [Anaerolineae bacterium]|nr:acetate kinase [Anaerolineae bacterium]MCO5199457.1 acetate kinase [Anaerolineae bacterium]MCO5205953.1 acetate kinase [Anaerolineae bacterium]